MVSDSATGLHRTYSAHASGTNDSAGIVRRVMLVGTALRTTIDILIKERLFKSEDSDIRNITLILGHFLNLVHDMKDTCIANENRWGIMVLERADERGFKPHLISINHVIREIREGRDDATSDGDGTPRPEIGSKREGLENAAKSYESKPWVGLVTLESLKAGVERSWKDCSWATEIRPPLRASRLSRTVRLPCRELGVYSKAQVVKVGPSRPIYGKRMGGRFYDLTTKGNQQTWPRGKRKRRRK